MQGGVCEGVCFCDALAGVQLRLCKGSLYAGKSINELAAQHSTIAAALVESAFGEAVCA